MIKTCSFDVGIKNLAYCILSKNNDQITIDKWDIINLVEDQIFTCCASVNKTDKVCNKNASLYGKNINGNTSYYCGTHKSKYDSLINTVQWVSIDDNTKLCGYIAPLKGTTCEKRSFHKTCIDGVDMYYCKAHQKLVVERMLKDTCLKKIKKQKCTDTDIQELCVNMYKKLDLIVDHLSTVDNVLIENQPSLQNPTMKTISSLLFGYFVNLSHKNNKKMTIRFISPSNKLKIDPTNTELLLNKIDSNDKIYTIVSKLLKDKINPSENFITDYFNNNDLFLKVVHLVVKYHLDKKSATDEINKSKLFDTMKINAKEFLAILDKIYKKKKNPDEKPDKTVYDITKLLGIKYTELLLVNQQQWINHLNGYQKKDDMCDAFLHGYYCV